MRVLVSIGVGLVAYGTAALAADTTSPSTPPAPNSIIWNDAKPASAPDANGIIWDAPGAARSAPTGNAAPSAPSASMSPSAPPSRESIIWDKPAAPSRSAAASSAPLVPPPSSLPRQTSAEANCREFQTTIVIDGKPQPAHGTACRQPDGSWRVTR